MKRNGWYGDKMGHSLASRGIRTANGIWKGKEVTDIELEYLEEIEYQGSRYGITFDINNKYFQDKFKLEYKGNEVEFNFSDLGDEKETYGFLINIEDSESIVQDILENMDDVFYDNIYRRVKARFKSQSGKNLAFTYIASRLRKEGVWVHS